LQPSEDLDVYQQNANHVEDECPPPFDLLLLFCFLFDCFEADHSMHDAVNFGWRDARGNNFISCVRHLRDEKTLLV
jgi:hypothetical protein